MSILKIESMILKYLSAEVKRKKCYECDVGSNNIYYFRMIGMNIQLKLFGMFWITIIKYVYHHKINK